MFLKLRRKFTYWLAQIFGSLTNPYHVVRNNLIEEHGLEEAFVAFDDGNLSTALKIFSEAAKRGNAVAQYNLGVCYETGSGLVAPDDQAAEEWYRKAAEQGIDQARYALCAILAGDFMAGQDNRPLEEQESRIVEAYMWLVLANAQGFLQAAGAIPRLEAHMTEEQIDSARRLANDQLKSDG